MTGGVRGGKNFEGRGVRGSKIGVGDAWEIRKDAWKIGMTSSGCVADIRRNIKRFTPHGRGNIPLTLHRRCVCKHLTPMLAVSNGMVYYRYPCL